MNRIEKKSGMTGSRQIFYIADEATDLSITSSSRPFREKHGFDRRLIVSFDTLQTGVGDPLENGVNQLSVNKRVCVYVNRRQLEDLKVSIERALKNE